MREKSHMTHQKFFKKITILNPRYSFNFIGNKTIFCGWGSSSVAIHMCSMHEALSLISSNSKQQSNKRTIKKKSLHAQSIFIYLFPSSLLDNVPDILEEQVISKKPGKFFSTYFQKDILLWLKMLSCYRGAKLKLSTHLTILRTDAQSEADLINLSIFS